MLGGETLAVRGVEKGGEDEDANLEDDDDAVREGGEDIERPFGEDCERAKVLARDRGGEQRGEPRERREKIPPNRSTRRKTSEMPITVRAKGSAPRFAGIASEESTYQP